LALIKIPLFLECNSMLIYFRISRYSFLPI